MDPQEKEKKVYELFNAISEGYDLANTRISLGMEKKWKNELIKLFSDPSSFRKAEDDKDTVKILDLCCGTGDIAIGIKKRAPDFELTGLDFSPAMLEIAAQKCPEGIKWLEGNATQLPFDDESFDGVCISFGLRNTPDYARVLAEIRRVLKTGGCAACLDSFVPENALIKIFYSIYFKGLMPLIGGRKKHRAEYRWLADSTELFLKAEELKALFEESGFKSVELKAMMMGACCLHRGFK